MANMAALDKHSFSGHGVIMGGHSNDWQDTGAVLQLFGDKVSDARRQYRWQTKEKNGHEYMHISKKKERKPFFHDFFKPWFDCAQIVPVKVKNIGLKISVSAA